MCDKTIYHIKKYSFNWKRLNPDYEIRLSDNNMCERFLLNQFSPLHRDIFKYIRDGPIKADFWRVCVLYKYGGIYIDADNEPIAPISSFLEKNVDFVTCSTYWNDKPNMLFNPNFIASTPEHIFLKRCIDIYIDMYKNKTSYSYWGWSIMKVFTQAIPIENYNRKEGIYFCSINNKRHRIQILQEVAGESHNQDHNIYKNKIVFYNRYKNWNSAEHRFE